jgi:hypothetical protein
MDEPQTEGKCMLEPTLKFSVTCPDCALESVSEMPIAVIANRLLTGKSLRLYSKCHDLYWTATFAERETLRKSLAVYSPSGRAVRASLRSLDDGGPEARLRSASRTLG